MIIKDTCYKGTRIIFGNEKPKILQKCRNLLYQEGFTEMQLPIIQYSETFNGKVGSENNNLMYNFMDRGNRMICLPPEYTAVIQQLATTTFKTQKNVMLFYIGECFRGEKPQAGRFRQFTQLGVEILNPTEDYKPELITLAKKLLGTMLSPITVEDAKKYYDALKVNENVTRGLDYYEEGKGFEITLDLLGSSKQIVGGGAYENGIGFAIGVDRFLTIKDL